MKRMAMKKGSALLIVLGMLSFMVVSAVGFAVYMRQSRVPSSYLRRNVSSRYLLKAALANAINRIDGCYNASRQRYEGIYDDPYPGVGPSQRGARMDDGNDWTKRVFTPFGLVSRDSTVSTMTLEGLAYLPPAIINEARVYTRLTQTAQWKNLAYDMGRYAFSAIDVSDCFDINKLLAGERRTSAPGQRINLSSLFPNNGQELDDALEYSDDIPFVSLADFNLFAKGTPFAPFCKYIPGGSNVSIYNKGDSEAVSNALFIVDTWFPPTNSTTSVKRIDLASVRPFNDMTARTFPEIDSNGNELYRLLMANLGGVGLTCLYDYLDEDRKPLTLALPTVETQPMICGVSVALDESLMLRDKTDGVVAKNVPFEENGVAYNLYRKVTPHKLVVPASTVMATGVAMFPFKVRNQSQRIGSWKVEALVAMFFATDDLQARLMKNTVIRPKESYWTSPPEPKSAGGVIWGRGSKEISFNANIQKTDDAIKGYQIEVRLKEAVFPVYYEVTEKLTRKAKGDQPEQILEEFTMKTTDQTRETDAGPLTIYDKNGDTSEITKNYYQSSKYREKVWFEDGDLKAHHGKESQNFSELNDETGCRPYLAVWVRVLDGNDTVDLVPANFADDTELLHVNYDFPEQDLNSFSGEGVPLLDFKLDHGFTLKKLTTPEENFYDSTPLKSAAWKSLYAVDPRYNFAPEDWFGTDDEDASVEQWKTRMGAKGNGDGIIGKGGRDPDVFMFTSDQEYLQSIGELAFLPFVQDMTGRASFLECDFKGLTRYHGRNDFSGREPGNKNGFANYERFWRTYTATSIESGDGFDPIYNLKNNGMPYEIVSGMGDFRVNPFSPDTRVLMAALKDTPFDWFVASTNDTNPTIGRKPKDRAAWAFCEESSVARLNDDELEDIAAKMCYDFGERARNGNANWEQAFEGLDWYSGGRGDNQKSLFGLDDFEEPLHGVDRKYLFSFWRECFQNRQQLFLVFIRAEPLTVGGSGSRSIGNSQLGARGVALVWRDPKPPAVANRLDRTAVQQNTDERRLAPHRTRVLFYHQFD